MPSSANLCQNVPLEAHSGASMWSLTRPTPSMAKWVALAVLNCGLLLGYLAYHPNFPGDFCAFYTGARLYLQDHHQLYNLGAQRLFEQQLIGRDDIPYYHPPYELLIWLPLAHFSFQMAFWIWRGISVCLLIFASCMLSRTLSTRFSAAKTFAIAMAFFPIPYCLWMGQDSLLLLAIFAASVYLLSRQDEFLAGLVFGLGLFKPELMLPIAAVYVLWRRWGFVGGILCSAFAVSALSLVMVGYSGLVQLVQVTVWGQTRSERMAVHPTMMPNLRGLVSLLHIADPPLQTILALILSITLFIVAVLIVKRQSSPERQFALLVPFAVLVSFHLNLHDLALLLLPIFVALQDRDWNTEYSWKLKARLAILFFTPLYLVTMGASKVALIALLVGWLWHTVAQQKTTWPERIPSPIAA